MTTSLRVIQGDVPESRNTAVARRLRELVAGEGTAMNWSRIADAIDMPQSSISRRANGTTPLTVDELDAICQFCRFNVVYVLTGEGDKRAPREDGPDGGDVMGHARPGQKVGRGKNHRYPVYNIAGSHATAA